MIGVRRKSRETSSNGFRADETAGAYAMANEIWPDFPDSEHKRFMAELYGTLCQHFVCLGVRLEVIDEEGNPTIEPQDVKFIACSVVEISSRWFLITAGHILKPLDEKLTSNKAKLVHAFLGYSLGHHETDGRLMPFDYEAAQKVFIHDQSLGLDYGFIALCDEDALRLCVNNIIPITLDDWKPPSVAGLQGYWMLGLPKEITRRLNEPHGASDDWTRKLGAVIVSAEAIRDELQIPFMLLIREPTFPVFVGKITADIDFDINGMSGGPIFGIMIGADGSEHYAVVAIQNEFDIYNNKILGCDMAEVVNALRNCLKA